MSEDAAAEAVAEAEQSPHVGRLDPLQRPAQPRLEGDAFVGLEEERVQHEGAELAVTCPGLALAEPLEGADIDEDGLRASPLDVVRRAVLEHKALVERFEKELELEQRRVLEHPECPLVGIGDDGEPVVAENALYAPSREHVRKPVGRAHALGGHDPARLRFGPEETAGFERLPVCEPALRERTHNRAAGREDAAVWIAEGARLGPGLQGRYSDSFFLTPRNPRSLRQ